MGGYYNSSRDPRLHSVDGIDHVKTASQIEIEEEEETKDQMVDPAVHEVPVSNVDATQTARDRIAELNNHITNLHAECERLAGENANLAKEKLDIHKRYDITTRMHSDVVGSHSKRVAEKTALIEKNAKLLQENKELRSENLGHVKDLIEKERGINMLNEEISLLKSAKMEDALEIQRVTAAKDVLQQKIDLMGDLNKKGAVQTGPTAPAAYRRIEEEPEERESGREWGYKRARYELPHQQYGRRHDPDGNWRDSRDASCRSAPFRERGRPGYTSPPFPMGRQPPTGPAAYRKN